MTPKVYVVQNSLRRDHATGGLIPKFDLTPAAKFGELVELLSAEVKPFNATLVSKELLDKLSRYCDDDFLLLVGNPILIGLATAAAAQINDGRVKFLQWSGSQKSYLPIWAEIPE